MSLPMHLRIGIILSTFGVSPHGFVFGFYSKKHNNSPLEKSIT